MTKKTENHIAPRDSALFPTPPYYIVLFYNSDEDNTFYVKICKTKENLTQYINEVYERKHDVSKQWLTKILYVTGQVEIAQEVRLDFPYELPA